MSDESITPVNPVSAVVGSLLGATEHPVELSMTRLDVQCTPQESSLKPSPSHQPFLSPLSSI